MTDDLKLMSLEGNRKIARLLSYFDGVAADAVFDVLDDADMRGLLELFQKERWGLFDWFPLEEGPSRWRVQLHKLADKRPRRRIREFFGYDHRRCDELYADLENAAYDGERDNAKKIFDRFIKAMHHHFKMEEEGFFPVFEEVTGMTQGPPMVMRMEHEQMRGIFKQMELHVQKGDLEGLLRAGSTLLLVMQQHNIKEEQMLYSMADNQLGAKADEYLKVWQRI
ncbi:MAG: hemerythrin domain-containing protein [Magnetococcus sp. DMHC-6]